MNIQIIKKGKLYTLQLTKKGVVWYETSARTKELAAWQMLTDLANRDDPKATPRVRLVEADMKQDWRVDPILILLAAVMMFLVCVLVLISWLLPAKEQLFMLVAGLITAASGSFFTRLDPKPHPQDTQVSTVQFVKTTTDAAPEPDKMKANDGEKHDDPHT